MAPEELTEGEERPWLSPLEGTEARKRRGWPRMKGLVG